MYSKLFLSRNFKGYVVLQSLKLLFTSINVCHFDEGFVLFLLQDDSILRGSNHVFRSIIVWSKTLNTIKRNRVSVSFIYSEFIFSEKSSVIHPWNHFLVLLKRKIPPRLSIQLTSNSFVPHLNWNFSIRFVRYSLFAAKVGALDEIN